MSAPNLESLTRMNKIGPSSGSHSRCKLLQICGAARDNSNQDSAREPTPQVHIHESPIIGDKLHPAGLDAPPNSEFFEFIGEGGFQTRSDLCETSSSHSVIRFRSMKDAGELLGYANVRRLAEP
jgi:hypothetical protein